MISDNNAIFLQNTSPNRRHKSWKKFVVLKSKLLLKSVLLVAIGPKASIHESALCFY